MMAKSEQLYNPVTEESFKILKTATDPCEESLKLKYVAYSNKSSLFATIHKHPEQTEIVNVISGCMEVWINGKTIRYEAGEMLVIKPGEAHRYWNYSKKLPLELLIETRPALRTIELIEFNCTRGQMMVKQQDTDFYPLHIAHSLQLFKDIFQLAGRRVLLRSLYYRLLLLINDLNAFSFTKANQLIDESHFSEPVVESCSQRH